MSDQDQNIEKTPVNDLLADFSKAVFDLRHAETSFSKAFNTCMRRRHTHQLGCLETPVVMNNLYGDYDQSDLYKARVNTANVYADIIRNLVSIDAPSGTVAAKQNDEIKEALKQILPAKALSRLSSTHADNELKNTGHESFAALVAKASHVFSSDIEAYESQQIKSARQKDAPGLNTMSFKHGII